MTKGTDELVNVRARAKADVRPMASAGRYDDVNETMAKDELLKKIPSLHRPPLDADGQLPVVE